MISPTRCEIRADELTLLPAELICRLFRDGHRCRQCGSRITLENLGNGPHQTRQLLRQLRSGESLVQPAGVVSALPQAEAWCEVIHPEHRWEIDALQCEERKRSRAARIAKQNADKEKSGGRQGVGKLPQLTNSTSANKERRIGAPTPPKNPEKFPEKRKAKTAGFARMRRQIDRKTKMTLAVKMHLAEG